MGRGVSSGGGQSSLGYLFGSGPEDKPPPPPRQVAPPKDPQNLAPAGISSVVQKTPAAAPADGPEKGASLDTGAPTLGRNSNNYHRADGQNAGNFITDRPSTKVHAAPGGGSSLGYLFGGGSN